MNPELQAIEGAAELERWFGEWPTFHDAEVLLLHLDRAGSSSILVHTWRMLPETDERGYYKLDKHVVVEFVLQGVQDLSFEDFSRQNVLFGLEVTKTEKGYRLELDPSYGVGGWITADNVAIKISPGRPPGNASPQDARTQPGA